MTAAHDPETPDVVIPAGAPILDAARWVGASSWAELRLHQVLTDLLRDGEAGPDVRPRWWAVRAHRAELAEAWHRRLPELAEMPRSGFVVPDEGSELVVDGDPVTTMRALLTRYRAHQEIAVGPADGPVAETLAVAVERTESDLALLTG